MGHIIVKEAEKLLDKEIKVLDKGFVRLVDYYGGDERIVQSARVSYGKGTKSVRQDKGLIDYLWQNEHTSPFEQVVFTFHCKLPLFVARQWIRHRTARLNEISGRYSVMKEEFYLPSKDNIKFQSTDNKQGRSEEEVSDDIKEKVLKIINASNSSSYRGYQDMLSLNIARELSRVNLPLNLYTEWYWQIDLKNLLHFLRLRMDSHAQYEIRAYANVMGDIVKTVCPYTWESFERHTLNSVKLSGQEIEILEKLFNNKTVDKEDQRFKELKTKLKFID